MSNRRSTIVPAPSGRLAVRSAGLARRGLAMLEQMASRANRRSGLGWAPLHIAALGDHRREAEMLLANGAEVDARDRFGHTPLFFARSAYMAQLLISHGANVNARREDGGTPLHRAARAGCRQSARILTSSGADVDAEQNGLTPLHFAARYGHWAVVELLLEHGADPNARDAEGATPLAAALSSGREDVVRLLRRHGAVG